MTKLNKDKVLLAVTLIGYLVLIFGTVYGLTLMRTDEGRKRVNEVMCQHDVEYCILETDDGLRIMTVDDIEEFYNNIN